MLFVSVFSMLAAVTFYTIGVFTEKKSNSLSTIHVIFFWSVLVFDTTGTTLIGKMSKGFILNIHGVTGLAALFLMFIHVVWATIVNLNAPKNKKKAFTNTTYLFGCFG